MRSGGGHDELFLVLEPTGCLIDAAQITCRVCARAPVKGFSHNPAPPPTPPPPTTTAAARSSRGRGSPSTAAAACACVHLQCAIIRRQCICRRHSASTAHASAADAAKIQTHDETQIKLYLLILRRGHNQARAYQMQLRCHSGWNSTRMQWWPWAQAVVAAPY